MTRLEELRLTELVAEQEGPSQRKPEADRGLAELDWLALMTLPSTDGFDDGDLEGLARVGSNHRFWIQSPASCH